MYYAGQHPRPTALRMPADCLARFISHIDFYLTGERQAALYTTHTSIPDLAHLYRAP